MQRRRRDTRVRGVRVASYEVGAPDDRDLAVVVPGLCVASYLWPACDALAGQGLQVKLVEPPGWPRSGRPCPEPRSVAELAEWITEWLTARDLQHVILVGQSMGAQVAAHVAAQAPERIRALVLQGPVFDPAYRTPVRALGRWALDVPRERPGLAVREVPEWLRVGPRRVRWNLRLSVADRLEDTVPAVKARVSVVLGERDTLAGRPWAAALATTPADFTVLPRLPHSSPHADPLGFARLIRGFVDR